MMRTMLRRVMTSVSYVPIYGQLVNSSRSSLVDAAKELLTATVFSLFPIWFYPVILYIVGDLPFWEILRSFVIRGELYLYSAALLGPLVYATTKTYGGSDSEDRSDESDPESQNFPRVWSIRFPYESLFSIISILVCCAAAVLFGMLRNSTYGPFAFELDEEAALMTSAVLYGFTLSCMFCVLVYRLNLEKVPERFGDDERRLLNQWHDLR